MCDAASERGITWIKFEMNQYVKKRAEELALQKYSQNDYTKKK